MIIQTLLIFALFTQNNSTPFLIHNVISPECSPSGKQITLDSFGPFTVTYPDSFTLISRIFIEFKPSLTFSSVLSVSLIHVPFTGTKIPIEFIKTSIGQPGTILIDKVNIGSANEYPDTSSGKSRLKFMLSVDYYRNTLDQQGNYTYALEVSAYVLDTLTAKMTKHTIKTEELSDFDSFSLFLYPSVLDSDIRLVFYQVMFHLNEKSDDIINTVSSEYEQLLYAVQFYEEPAHSLFLYDRGPYSFPPMMNGDVNTHIGKMHSFYSEELNKTFWVGLGKSSANYLEIPVNFFSLLDVQFLRFYLILDFFYWI